MEFSTDPSDFFMSKTKILWVLQCLSTHFYIISVNPLKILLIRLMVIVKILKNHVPGIGVFLAKVLLNQIFFSRGYICRQSGLRIEVVILH